MANVATESWSIGRLLNWTRDFLAGKDVEEPRLAAELLLAAALGCRKIDLYARFEQTPTPQQLDAIRASVRDAGAHKPIAYITGRKEFYSLEFLVSPAVLIPRPETELLVERTIAHCRGRSQPLFHVLDVGTGSGCIAVAIARFLPGARVVATDCSADALAVAAQNIERLKVGDRVRLFAADGLALPTEARPVGPFDVIVSNPPYIPEAQMATLPPNIRDYEPRGALCGGSDGLDLMRKIAAGARDLLSRDGCCLVEVASGQDEAAARVFTDSGWRHVETLRDGAGIPRVLALEPRS